MRGAETVIVSSASLAITLHANNVTIDGVTVIGNGDYGGIGNDYPASVTGTVITNNIVTCTDPLGWGVSFYNDGTPTFATISHNLISGGQIGVLLYNNAYGSVTDNTITDVERGVQTGNMYLPSPLPGDAEISHNHISAEIVGIYHNLSYGTATAYTIDDNQVTGEDGAMLPPSGTGIRVLSISSPGGAIVTDNDVSGFNAGIQLWNDTNVVVHGGNVTGNNVGIAALNNHPTFGNASGPGDYGIDGVNLSGNGVDLQVQDTELSIDDTSGTSTFRRSRCRGRGDFDDGGHAGLVVASDFIAASGDQTVNGGDGIDTYDVSPAGAGGAYVDLDTGGGTGHSFSSATGFDTLTSIENVKGSVGNDHMFGTAGDNTFFASGGTDTIDGRGGSDTYDASAATTAVSVNLDSGAGSASGRLFGFAGQHRKRQDRIGRRQHHPVGLQQ